MKIQGRSNHEPSEIVVGSEKPLQSWKEIAAYLDRSERTARRWEKVASLPVHRLYQDKRSSVYAYPSELDAWRATRDPETEERRTGRLLWKWSVPLGIGVLVVGLVVWFFKFGPILNPPNPLVEADGITIRQVWAETGVDDLGNVSSDGKFLTYVDWDTGDLAMRDLDTEVNRRLTNKGTWEESDEFAQFSIVSPDGKQIAYCWYNEQGSYELRLLDLTRSETQVLLRCEGEGEGEDYVKPMDWLPDAKTILVGLFGNSKRGQIALLSLSDRSVRPIALSVLDNTGAMAKLSPDGKHIVYDHISEGKSDQRDIFTIPTSDGQSIHLVNHPADDYMPIWSPDGRYVLFASDRTGSTGLWMIRIENGEAADEPELVKSDLGPLRSVIGCTRQGNVYLSLSAGMQDIYFFDLDPTNGKVVRKPSKLAGRYEGANRGPVFSPDGEYVAYHFQRAPQLMSPGALTLIVRSLKTGNEREIHTRLIQYGPVQWFPDGDSVLVAALRSPRERLVDYYRVDLDSGQTELIRKSAPDYFPSQRPYLSTNGESIFFTEAQRQGFEYLTTVFKRFEIKSGQEDVIHRLPRGKKVMSIQLSPDEENIAWVEQSQKTFNWSVNTKPVQGGATREILRLEQPEYLNPNSSIVWVPDGQHLLVSKFAVAGEGSRPELLRLSLEGDEPSTLGISMERITFGDVHKSGRLVAVSSGQPRGRAKEIWSLEGFLSEEGVSE